MFGDNPMRFFGTLLSELFQRPDPEAPTLQGCAMQERRADALFIGRFVGGVTAIEIEREKQFLFRMRLKCTSENNSLPGDIIPATNLEDDVMEIAETLVLQEYRAIDFFSLFDRFVASADSRFADLTERLLRVHENTQYTKMVGERHETRMHLLGQELNRKIDQLETVILQSTQDVVKDAQIRHQAMVASYAQAAERKARANQECLTMDMNQELITGQREMESRIIESTRQNSRELGAQFNKQVWEMECRITNNMRCEARESEHRIIAMLNVRDRRIFDCTWTWTKEVLAARMKETLSVVNSSQVESRTLEDMRHMISALEGRTFENASKLEVRSMENMRLEASKLEGRIDMMAGQIEEVKHQIFDNTSKMEDRFTENVRGEASKQEGRIDRMEGKIEEVKLQTSANACKVEGVLSKVESQLFANAITLEERIGDVKGQITDAERRISSRMGERIGEVKGQIGQVERRIFDVEQGMKGQIGDAERRISSKMEERIGAVEERIGGRIEGMESRLAAQMHAMLEALGAPRAAPPLA
jgi:hypothetical protein